MADWKMAAADKLLKKLSGPGQMKKKKKN